MTAEEMAFYELTEKAWNITQIMLFSVNGYCHNTMRGFGLPVLCLAEVDGNGVFDVVQKYIELVQKEGNEAHKKAVEIGKIATVKTMLADNLSALLTSENCQNGMREFLKSFEDGKILSLAGEIGATSTLLSDIRALFAVKHSCLWDKQTGEEEIRKLLTDYGIVKETNIILSSTAHSRSEAFKEWRERLKFIGISCEALKLKLPSLTKVFDTLMKIYQQSDVLADQLKTFHAELVAHVADIRNLLSNDKTIFAEVYAPYLEDLSDTDIGEVKSKLPTGMFELSKTDINVKFNSSAYEFRKNQLKTQMFKLWKDKTGTKNPFEWSNRFRTPILCCVNEKEFETAKKVFETLNRSWATDAEIKAAIAFLESTSLFEVLLDEGKRNEAFVRGIVDEYRFLLPNLNKVRDVLERLTVDTYNWRGNPSVENKVKQLAEAEYIAGGSDIALSKLDQMDDAQLKQYLKRLVKRYDCWDEIIMAEGKSMSVKSKQVFDLQRKYTLFPCRGDEQYQGVKDKMSELGLNIIKVSDYCRKDDKLPDIDGLLEQLKTADVNANCKRIAVIGLGEYLGLRGNGEAVSVLSQLKDLNLGTAKAVLLLRGVTTQVKGLQTDPRFDGRRFSITETANCDLSITLAFLSYDHQPRLE